MSIRIIRVGNDPVLRQVAKPVQNINRAIEKLLDDMVETMHAAEGIGLAANQIGILKRLIVMDVGQGLVELINPEIISRSGSDKDTEGCLSLPGIRGKVDRSTHITVHALNRQGDLVVYEMHDLLARCAQHEIDHLNGVLFTDYVSPGEIEYVSEGESRRK